MGIEDIESGRDTVIPTTLFEYYCTYIKYVSLNYPEIDKIIKDKMKIIDGMKYIIQMIEEIERKLCIIKKREGKLSEDTKKKLENLLKDIIDLANNFKIKE